VWPPLEPSIIKRSQRRRRIVSIGAAVTANIERNHCGAYISVVRPIDAKWDDRVGNWFVRTELKAYIRESRPGKFGV